jgi:aspartate aminotransferase
MNSVSKAWLRPGWRIGYAGRPEALIKAMGDVQSPIDINPSSIGQAPSGVSRKTLFPRTMKFSKHAAI